MSARGIRDDLILHKSLQRSECNGMCEFANLLSLALRERSSTVSFEVIVDEYVCDTERKE